MKQEIGRISINLATRELRAYDTSGQPISWPLSSHGGSIIKWVNVSPGGHMIRALERLLQNLYDDGGDRV